MEAIYINDGTIPRRINQSHWCMPEFVGKTGTVIEIDESNGTFEYYHPELKLPIFCNREEIIIIPPNRNDN